MVPHPNEVFLSYSSLDWWSLVSTQFVDFTEDFEKGCRALMWIWGMGYSALDPDAN